MNRHDANECAPSDWSKQTHFHYFSLAFEAPEALLLDLSQLLPFPLDCFESFTALPWPLVPDTDAFDLLPVACEVLLPLVTVDDFDPEAVFEPLCLLLAVEVLLLLCEAPDLVLIPEADW